MAISAIGSAVGSFGSSQSASSVDTESMSLQTKIAQTQQKIRNINSSSVMSQEEKDKQEEQLKTQLGQLRDEYRQHKLDLQTQKRQELLKSEISEDTNKAEDNKAGRSEESVKASNDKSTGKAYDATGKAYDTETAKASETSNADKTDADKMNAAERPEAAADEKAADERRALTRAVLSDDTETIAAKMRSTAGLERQARLLQSEIKVDSMRPETSTESKDDELDEVYTRLYKNAGQDFMSNNSQVVTSTEDGIVTANVAAASGMFANAMVDFTL